MFKLSGGLSLSHAFVTYMNSLNSKIKCTLEVQDENRSIIFSDITIAIDDKFMRWVQTFPKAD